MYKCKILRFKYVMHNTVYVKIQSTDKIICAKYSWVRSVDVPGPVAARSKA
jgi:hypothetical protein